jgi:hypothetical protein
MIFNDESLRGFPECPHYKGRKVAIEDVKQVHFYLLDFISKERYSAD